jgi:intein/homing endonuclease
MDSFYIALSGAQGTGKCVKKGSILFTQHGMVPIEYYFGKNNIEDTVKRKKIELFTNEGIKNTSHTYEGGNKNGYEIITRSGYNLGGTSKHKILIWNKNCEFEYKKLKDIKKGEYAVIQRGQNYFGQEFKIKFNFKKKKHTSNFQDCKVPRILDKDLAELLGWLVGEGYIYGNSVRFSNKDVKVVKRIQKLFKKKFTLKLHACSKESIDYVITSAMCKEFLIYLGLKDVISCKKEIPYSILRSPKNIIKYFIRAIFDAEAYVSKKHCEIEFASASEKLVDQLMMCLLNFNIVCFKRKRQKMATNGKWIKRNYYSLFLNKSNCEIFAKEIGFGLENKKKLLDTFSKKNNCPKYDYIPYIKQMVVNIRNKYCDKKGYLLNPLTNSKIAKIVKTLCRSFKWNNRKEVNYQHLKEIFEYHQYSINEDEKEKIQYLLSKHYFFDPVSEKIKQKMEVYDLTVPKIKNFICNGFIAHNTTLGDKLEEYLKEKDNTVYRIKNVSRRLAEQGVLIDEKGTIESQIKITTTYWQEEIENDGKFDVIISDRCFADQYAYAIANELPTSMLEWYGGFLRHALARYNRIIYVPVEFGIEDDGVRNIDENYQKKIAELIKKLLDDYATVVKVSGTVNERLNGIILRLPHEILKVGEKKK